MGREGSKDGMALVSRIVVVALLVVGLAASAFVGVQRARVESGDRAVELVVDYDEVRQLAAAAGTSPVDVLKRLKGAGATSVAVTELTWKDAVDRGEIVASTPRQYYDHAGLAQRLRKRFPNAETMLEIQGLSGLWGEIVTVSPQMPIAYLEQLPLGMPPQALSVVTQAGLEVIARPVNSPGVTRSKRGTRALHDTRGGT